MTTVPEDARCPKADLVHTGMLPPIRHNDIIVRVSPRDALIIQGLARGDHTRDLAANLGYAERTIKVAIHGMVSVLAIRTRAQLVAWAYEKGLLKVGS